MKTKTKAKASVVKLRLYIAGKTSRSDAAIGNLNQLCSEYADIPFQVEVIDLQKTPALAKDHQILALPTLVRSLPNPIRKVIGDLSDRDRVLVGLDIYPREARKQRGNPRKQPRKA